jgi:cytochrome c553
MKNASFLTPLRAQIVGSVALFLLFSSQLLTNASAADIEAGRQKAQVCVACHGAGGNSEIEEIPALAGQTTLAITTALYQFREGNRKNPVMSPFAVNLSNADMNNLAAYFAAEKRVQKVAHTASADSTTQGPELAKQYNCVQCHGPQLLGQQHIPRIAGQQYSYLLAQLKGFKATTRADMDGNMSSAASMLKDSDIEILADYIASLQR